MSFFDWAKRDMLLHFESSKEVKLFVMDKPSQSVRCKDGTLTTLNNMCIFLCQHYNEGF